MLEVEGLTKAFGEMKAVDNVSFRIPYGKIFFNVFRNILYE